jgi:hypothetical protein
MMMDNRSHAGANPGSEFGFQKLKDALLESAKRFPDRRPRLLKIEAVDRSRAIRQLEIEHAKAPSQCQGNRSPEQIVDAILAGETNVIPGDQDPGRYRPTKRVKVSIHRAGIVKQRSPFGQWLARYLKRFNEALNRKVDNAEAERERAKEQARVQRMLDDAEARPAPWFTEPRPLAPNQDGGLRLYLGGVPIRTAAQLHEDASSCSRCLKKLVDNDPEWWTKAGWRDPRRDLSGNPPRDEAYRFKYRFTSRRYCKPCYKLWIGEPKTRTVNESSTHARVNRPYVQKISFDSILNALPGGIMGEILRHMITASTPVVLKNGLINAIKGEVYSRESVRKGVGSLIRDGHLDESKGPHGLDAPMVLLSQKTVTKYQLEIDQEYQQSATKDNAGAFIDAFPENKRRSTITGRKQNVPCWVVREVPRDSDAEDGDGKDVDDAFDMADRAWGNPYAAGRTNRRKFSDCDGRERSRWQGEWVDGYRNEASYTLSPLDLLIQKEEESWDCDEPGIPRTWVTRNVLQDSQPSRTPSTKRRGRTAKGSVKKVAGRNQGYEADCYRRMDRVFKDDPGGPRPTLEWFAKECGSDSLTPPRKALKRFRESETFKSRRHLASDSWNPSRKPRKRRTGQQGNSA